MSKTEAGFLSVAGLVCAIVFATMAGMSARANRDISSDWFYDALKYTGILGALVGVGMFFYGALIFARKT